MDPIRSTSAALVFMLYATCTLAQIPLLETYWKRTVSGSGQDSLMTAIESNTGGILLVWSSNSCDGWSGDCRGGKDIVLTELSSDGDVQWQTRIGGNGDDVPVQIVRGTYGYLLVALSSSRDTEGHNHGEPFVNGGVTLQPDHSGRNASVAEPWLFVIRNDGNEIGSHRLSQPTTGIPYVPRKVKLFGSGIFILSQRRIPGDPATDSYSTETVLHCVDWTGKELRRMEFPGGPTDFVVEDFWPTSSKPMVLSQRDGRFGHYVSLYEQNKIPEHSVYLIGYKNSKASQAFVIREGDVKLPTLNRFQSASKAALKLPTTSDCFVMKLDKQWNIEWAKQYILPEDEFPVSLNIARAKTGMLTFVYASVSAAATQSERNSWEQYYQKSRCDEVAEAVLSATTIDANGRVQRTVRLGTVPYPDRCDVFHMVGSDDLFIRSDRNILGASNACRVDRELGMHDFAREPTNFTRTRGVDFWDARRYYGVGESGGKWQVISQSAFEEPALFSVKSTVAPALPNTSHVVSFEGKGYSFVFASHANDDIELICTVAGSNGPPRNAFSDKIPIGTKNGSLEAHIVGNRRSRAEALLGLWSGKNDWRAMARAGFTLEASNDYAAAAHYYGLAHEEAKNVGVTDSLTTLRAHHLACQFFSKSERPSNKSWTASGSNIMASIGTLLARSDGKLIVVDVFKGSGAEKMGIWAGDRITHIDGADISTIASMDSITARLTGRIGETIEIRTERLGRKETKTLNVSLLIPAVLASKDRSSDTSQPPIANTNLPNYNAELANDYQAREAAKVAMLDANFKEVSKWPTVARSAALLQQVNRCLEILNRMAKEPVESKTFQDVDMGLGLVGVLAQVVAESGQRKEQLGQLRELDAPLRELAQNGTARERAETVVPSYSRTVDGSSRDKVELEGGTVIVSATHDMNINGRYACVGHKSTATSYHQSSGAHTYTQSDCMAEAFGGTKNYGTFVIDIKVTITVEQNGDEVVMRYERTTTSHGTNVHQSGGVRHVSSGTLNGNIISFTEEATDWFGIEAAGEKNFCKAVYSTNEMHVLENGDLLHRVVGENPACNQYAAKQTFQSETTYRRLP